MSNNLSPPPPLLHLIIFPHLKDLPGFMRFEQGAFFTLPSDERSPSIVQITSLFSWRACFSLCLGSVLHSYFLSYLSFCCVSADGTGPPRLSPVPRCPGAPALLSFVTGIIKNEAFQLFVHKTNVVQPRDSGVADSTEPAFPRV